MPGLKLLLLICLPGLVALACGRTDAQTPPNTSAQAAKDTSAPATTRSKGNSSASRGAASAGPPRAPVEVRLADVQTTQLEQTIRIVGTLFGSDDVTISAEVPGRLESTRVDIGDRVAPGDELARIDPVDYQLQVDQAQNALREALAKLGLTELPRGKLDIEAVATVQRAKAQARNTEVRLERARSLFERDPPLLSSQEFADIETASEVANGDYEVAKLEAESQLAVARSRQSELEAARKRLGDTRVKTPPIEHAAPGATRDFAVTKRNVAAGEFVRAGDPLYDLVLDDPIKLRGAIPERNLGEVKIGQTARIQVESDSGFFTGEVARINPAVDVQSRTFEVEIALPNTAKQLRPGTFAHGMIVVGDRDRIPLVPRDAVISFAGIDRVFSVSDGKAVEHIVELGPLRQNHFVINRGLENTRQVIIEGNARLSRNDPVKVLN